MIPLTFFECLYSDLNNIHILEKTKNIKGIIHPKTKILQSFIYPHVIPNKNDFLSSVEH